MVFADVITYSDFGQAGILVEPVLITSFGLPPKRLSTLGSF